MNLHKNNSHKLKARISGFLITGKGNEKKSGLRRLFLISLAVCAAAGLFGMSGFSSRASEKDAVIVIDPGHGGSNEGAQINGMFEKDITMVTAMAMKEELEKYEGVTVYLTRYGDADLSLAERAQIAANYQADFFYCLHYNMSSPHNLFGAEVWIPSTGINYAKGYSAGDLVLNELCDNYGLYRRGIKTKLGSSGADYYGILRQSDLLGVPCVLVEHCHMDNANDVNFYNSIEKMQQLGRLDATAAAKYFRLKSAALGIDYSNYSKTEVAAPAFPVMQDLTPPVNVTLAVNQKTGNEASVTIQAQEMESTLLYYDYSNDGGLTWSPLQKWQTGSNSCTVNLPLNSSAASRTLLVRVYNNYDLGAQSNSVSY